MFYDGTMTASTIGFQALIFSEFTHTKNKSLSKLNYEAA